MQILLGLTTTGDTQKTGEDCVNNYEREPRAHSIKTFQASLGFNYKSPPATKHIGVCVYARESQASSKTNAAFKLYVSAGRLCFSHFSWGMRGRGRIAAQRIFDTWAYLWRNRKLSNNQQPPSPLVYCHWRSYCPLLRADKKQQSVISGAHLTRLRK